jgi:hypothetical protein
MLLEGLQDLYTGNAQYIHYPMSENALFLLSKMRKTQEKWSPDHDNENSSFC